MPPHCAFSHCRQRRLPQAKWTCQPSRWSAHMCMSLRGSYASRDASCKSCASINHAHSCMREILNGIAPKHTSRWYGQHVSGSPANRPNRAGRRGGHRQRGVGCQTRTDRGVNSRLEIPRWMGLFPAITHCNADGMDDAKPVRVYSRKMIRLKLAHDNHRLRRPAVMTCLAPLTWWVEPRARYTYIYLVSGTEPA